MVARGWEEEEMGGWEGDCLMPTGFLFGMMKSLGISVNDCTIL